jgi:hypothetical protein
MSPLFLRGGAAWCRPMPWPSGSSLLLSLANG